VTIAIEGEQVSVTGTQVGRGTYRLWIALQAACLTLVLPAIIAAILLGDWRLALVAIALLFAHGAIGGIGAGCLWELQNLIDFGEGSPGRRVSFSKAEVKDIRIGPGWARKGMALLLLPYVKGIDAMAKDVVVSFEAPAGAASDAGVYAIHMRSPRDAAALAETLRHT